MIGKVLRGTHAGRLLYYLYGPGRANEHTDPHLIAGFADPGELEPGRRRDGSRDLRRLSGLLAQPLAALAGPGYGKPVWHCAVRAAPGDRLLSDAEWAQVAAGIMDKTGLAPAGDELGVRWVAVRHAADHLHLVATLARQDGARPKIWNDFYRVREACQAAEVRFGLRATAPADRTAARRPARAESEQAARRGWAEPPRVTLCREVAVAAAGAGSEADFFARLAEAGVAARKRYSTTSPGEVTGYAVGLPWHDEPHGDASVRWDNIEPSWLREGVKFCTRLQLETGQLTLVDGDAGARVRTGDPPGRRAQLHQRRRPGPHAAVCGATRDAPGPVHDHHPPRPGR